MSSEPDLKPASQYPFLPDMTEEEVVQLQKDTAKQLGLDVIFHDVMKAGFYAPEMVVIPPGQFEMGAPRTEFGCRPEEMPQHYVVISEPFALGRFVVTAAEFEVFCEDTGWTPGPSLIWAEGNSPVINVRYPDARLFAEWMSDQTGHTYRLPSEAEWEYAARAGTSTPFHYGESVSCKDVNFNPVFPYQEAKESRKWYLPRCLPSIVAADVGDKKPNCWGLHEMHGNVWEFTLNPWTQSHINANRDGSVVSFGDPMWVVTKGGSWFDPAVKARSAARMKRMMDELDVNLGFRLLREL